MKDPTDKVSLELPLNREFCIHCGSGVGEFKREGEASCPNCPVPVIYSENHRE